MPHSKLLRVQHAVLCVLVLYLIGICIELVSAWLVLPPWRQLWWRAGIDSGCHGAIGVITWFAALFLAAQDIYMKELILAGLAAVAIDLDHFLAAGSFSLFAATRLKSRPFCHSVLAILILPLCGLIFSRRYALLLFVTTSSHQARDAMRRGFWLLGSLQTTPIPRNLYPLTLFIIAATTAILLPSSLSTRSPSTLLPFFSLDMSDERYTEEWQRSLEEDQHQHDAHDDVNSESSSWWWWSESLSPRPTLFSYSASYSRRRRSHPTVTL